MGYFQRYVFRNDMDVIDKKRTSIFDPWSLSASRKERGLQVGTTGKSVRPYLHAKEQEVEEKLPVKVSWHRNSSIQTGYSNEH